MLAHVDEVGNTTLFGSTIIFATQNLGFRYLNPRSGGLSAPVQKERNFSLYVLSREIRKFQKFSAYSLSSGESNPCTAVFFYKSTTSISLRPPVMSIWIS